MYPCHDLNNFALQGLSCASSTLAGTQAMCNIGFIIILRSEKSPNICVFVLVTLFMCTVFSQIMEGDVAKEVTE